MKLCIENMEMTIVKNLFPATSSMTSVKLYTAPMCSQCIRVKEFLNFIDVRYDELNIEEDEGAEKELENLTGQSEAPVLAVGDDVVEGFDRELIVEVLEENDIEVDQAPSPR